MHAACQRDGLPAQADRIAAAVPPLVVRHRDLLRPPQHLGRAAGEDRGAGLGVALDLLELLRGQPRRLQQQLVGDRELADVVQLRGAGDILAVAAREAERERDGGRERRHLAGVVEQRRLFVGQQLQKNFGGRPASARRDSKRR